MITILTGAVASIPWWRLRYMTGKDIADYNRKFLKETKMTDDSLNDQVNNEELALRINKLSEPKSILFVDNLDKTIADMKASHTNNVGMRNYCVRCGKEFMGDWRKHDCSSLSVFEKEIWNAAIEAAVKCAKPHNEIVAREIMELKK